MNQNETKRKRNESRLNKKKQRETQRNNHEQ